MTTTNNAADMTNTFNIGYCAVKATCAKLSLAKVNADEELTPETMLHIVKDFNGAVVSEQFTLEGLPALAIIGYFDRVAYKFKNNLV